MTPLTLGEFKRLTAALPDDTVIYYHGYDKGLCLNGYTTEDMWLYPKDAVGLTEHPEDSSLVRAGIVINPASNYDGRGARQVT